MTGKHRKPEPVRVITEPTRASRIANGVYRAGAWSVVGTLGGVALYLGVLAPDATPTAVAQPPATTAPDVSTTAPSEPRRVEPNQVVPPTTREPVEGWQRGAQAPDRGTVAAPAPQAPATTEAPLTFSVPAPAPEVDYRAGRTTAPSPEQGNIDDLAACAAEALDTYANDPISFVRDIALQRCLFYYDPAQYNQIMSGLR